MHYKNIILGLIILLKFAIQYYLINNAYDLHRDEYLHLDQANHLAFGFQSVPPFSSIIAFIIKSLGNSLFWVKFFPTLFGAITIIIAWKIIEEIKGGIYAQILCAAALLFSALLRLNALFQPNSADVLFWTVCFYFLIKYINAQNGRNLIYLAVFFAIGLLNKYNIIFFAIGLLPALLISENRKVFLDKNLYIAGIITFLIVLPNLIWQYNNDFQVVKHMNALAATQLVHVKRADFVKDQFLFFINSAFIILFSFYAFFKYKPFKKYQIVFWTYLFCFSIFLFLKAKSYYSIGLYPVLLAFGSVYLEEILSKGWLKKIRFALPVLVIGLFIPIIPIAFPLSSPEKIKMNSKKFESLGLLRWEDGKNHDLPQDFADMLCWKEMAEKVEKRYETVSKTGFTLVLCDNYGEAGAINYYAKNKNINAVAFSADYLNWFPLQQKIRNVILIKDTGDTDPNREDEKVLFEKITLVDSISNHLAREYGTKIYVLESAKIDITGILKEDIQEENSINYGKR